MATVVSGTAVYLLDESDNRNLWMIGSGLMASIFPWTMIVMMPDINRLLKDNVVREQGKTFLSMKRLKIPKGVFRIRIHILVRKALKLLK